MSLQVTGASLKPANFVVREAKKEDLSSVCEMVRKLRVFHKRPPEEITEAKFEKYAFSDHTNTRVFVAEMDGNNVGLAVFNMKPVGNEIQLEDLFVFEEFRGNGIGTELLKRVAQVGVRHDCEGITWQVADDNEKGLKFYASIGSTERRDLAVIRLAKEKFESMAVEQGEQPCTLRKASQTDASAISNFVKMLTKLDTKLNLSSESGYVEVAERDGHIIGVALANCNFAAFQGDMELVLEALYVDPEHSGSTVKQALFSKIVRIAQEKEYCRVAMNVLKEEFEFYEQFGAVKRDFLVNVCLSKQTMHAFGTRI